ncbi:MAG: formylmethanofuran dehydrogenase subunit C [Gemmatimonadales bacterium]|nr:formylmethanofuran dehydrogenase subunit C [Gemmatimonadales bacterium]
MSDGLVARLKRPLDTRADFGEAFAGEWRGLGAAELATRSVRLAGGPVPLGDLLHISGSANGALRLEGDFSRADRVGAGLASGTITVVGQVGDEAGLGMSGGALIIEGDAGRRAGAASSGYRRGMTGGELIVRGSAGPEAGASMRRGLIAIGGDAAEYAGLGLIAGTIVVFGASAAGAGQWSKRGSLVALGSVTPPATYTYACTYWPPHVGLILTRLRDVYRLPVRDIHITGRYRRYSGDLAELGKGEILAWQAE